MVTMATIKALPTLVIFFIAHTSNADVTVATSPSNHTDTWSGSESGITLSGNSTGGSTNTGYGASVLMMVVGGSAALMFAAMFAVSVHTYTRRHGQTLLVLPHNYKDEGSAAAITDVSSAHYDREMVKLQGFSEYPNPNPAPTDCSTSPRTPRPSPRASRPTAAPPPVPTHGSNSYLNGIQFSTASAHDLQSLNRLSTASTPSETVRALSPDIQHSTLTLPAAGRTAHRPPPPIPTKPKPERIRQVCAQMASQGNTATPNKTQSMVRRPPAPTSPAPLPPRASGVQKSPIHTPSTFSPTTKLPSVSGAQPSPTHSGFSPTSRLQSVSGAQPSPPSFSPRTRFPSVPGVQPSPTHSSFSHSPRLQSASGNQPSPTYSPTSASSTSSQPSVFGTHCNRIHAPAEVALPQPSEDTELPLVVRASLGPRLSAEKSRVEMDAAEDAESAPDGYMVMHTITTFQPPSAEKEPRSSSEGTTRPLSSSSQSGAERQSLLYETPRFHNVSQSSMSLDSGSSCRSIQGSSTTASGSGVDWAEPQYHNA